MSATDNFNRADDGFLGANWTLPYSGTPTMFRIVSNQCKSPAGTGIRGIFWNASSFSDNQYAKVKLIVFSTPFSTGFGAAVRCSGTAGGDNFCGYTFHSDGSNWKLSRQDSGVATDLATGTATFSVNDIIEIRASGTTISGYQNGSAVSGASATDATYASGKAGIVCANVGVIDPICDDWEGGDIVVNVSVSLTGVAADPQIGVGTVTIGTVTVTPPVQEYVPGPWDWWPKQKTVYLEGVAADPQVGSGTVRTKPKRVDLLKLYSRRQITPQPLKIPPLVTRKRSVKAVAPPPPIAFDMFGVKSVPVVGKGTIKTVFGLLEEEVISIFEDD